MALTRRVSYRRHCHYATKGNKFKIVRTPGSKLVLHYTPKRTRGVRAPKHLGGEILAGIKHLNAKDRSKASKSRLTVSRPYGGVFTHRQVRERIIRAFLVEEQKIVKRVLKAQTKKK
eukprot:NODE_7464_length_566_cov_90.702128_g6450_i0.p1 GENE.NODE_7464_length_566_cov_90.702128_g6450_i0~~NODE_7464_length_566_cov_90.702128_g6450_i0.p1  ORF type:complete len:117 (-),score=36.10 NODE_7464_length_566_cov_90.702128_g6450_i0:127-477(-)